jgi:thiamine kinase-like enzyme
MTTLDPLARAAALSFWSGPVEPIALKGGITNANFEVRDRGRRFFVRIGDDIPVHGVMRFAELAASRAAHAAGLAPAVLHHEPGALVFDFIEGRTLTPEAVRPRSMLERILPLVKRCHYELPRHLRGPVLMFWPFHIFRDYAASLRDANSPRVRELPPLLAIAEDLERRLGAIELVFGHNDLLCGNLIDDGSRLWLIDYDYAGYSSALFDLGNLCSNNEVTPADEEWLLGAYFERPVDDQLRHRYQAMKCASLLRETMWSMIAESFSTLDFDYAAYTADYRARFQQAYDSLKHH